MMARNERDAGVVWSPLNPEPRVSNGAKGDQGLAEKAIRSMSRYQHVSWALSCCLLDGLQRLGLELQLFGASLSILGSHSRLSLRIYTVRFETRTWYRLSLAVLRMQCMSAPEIASKSYS